jgi:hypothetical protein
MSCAKHVSIFFVCENKKKVTEKSNKASIKLTETLWK